MQAVSNGRTMALSLCSEYICNNVLSKMLPSYGQNYKYVKCGFPLFSVMTSFLQLIKNFFKIQIQ